MARDKVTPKFWCLWGLLLTFLACATAFDNSVYILSKYRQRVTSSTLNWLPIAHYDPSKEIVIGGFATQRQSKGNGDNNHTENPAMSPIYVCRINLNGVLVVGSQIDGEKRCTVTYLGNVATYERYELLENVDNSARLSWFTWDKLHKIPIGAVAAETAYVARHAVPNDLVYTHHIGTYDSSEGTAAAFGKITYVKNDGKEGTAESGEILVETEPVFYELNAVKLNYHRKRILKRTPKILRETTISNTHSEPADLAKALDYTFNYSIYWGQGHAMIKALNTSITKVEGTKLGYILWGIDDKSIRSNATTVEIRLEPGTAVNVTLKANYTDMEIPYIGDLVSLYEDGERRSRPVSGMCREETMMDVKVEFGPIYYLSNMSLVPTTQAPPTTEAVTSTSTTAKQPEYTMSKGTRVVGVTSTDIDENLIIPPRKSEAGNNMQNDDGGPLSLKDKVQNSEGTVAFKPSVALLALSAVAYYRIT